MAEMGKCEKEVSQILHVSILNTALDPQCDIAKRLVVEKLLDF